MATPQSNPDASATKVAAWLTAGCAVLALALWGSTCSRASDADPPDSSRGARPTPPSPQQQPPRPMPAHEDVEIYRKMVTAFRSTWDRVGEQTRDTLHEGKARFDKSVARLAGADSRDAERNRVLRLAENMVVDVWNRETATFNEFARKAAEKVDSGAYASKDRDSILDCIGDATDDLKKLRRDLVEEARLVYGR